MIFILKLKLLDLKWFHVYNYNLNKQPWVFIFEELNLLFISFFYILFLFTSFSVFTQQFKHLLLHLDFILYPNILIHSSIHIIFYY